MLCKFQNCTNPSCAFRHEDADGNPIPPPALTASKVKKEIKVVKVEVPAPSSDNEDGDMEVVVSSKSLMDGPLEDATGERPCRYGERCTRRQSTPTPVETRLSTDACHSGLQVFTPRGKINL